MHGHILRGAKVERLGGDLCVSVQHQGLSLLHRQAHRVAINCLHDEHVSRTAHTSPVAHNVQYLPIEFRRK